MISYRDGHKIVIDKYPAKFPKDVWQFVIFPKLTTFSKLKMVIASKYFEKFAPDFAKNHRWNRTHPNLAKRCFKLAAENGRDDILKFIIPQIKRWRFRGKWSGWREWGMACAARNGHINLVKQFISEGARNLKFGLSEASKGGHVDVVEYLIHKGTRDFDWAMMEAITNSHPQIVKLLFSNGYNNLEWCLELLEALED